MKARDMAGNAARAVLKLAILGTAGLQLYAGRPWRQPPYFWLGFLGFSFWGLIPYLLLLNQVDFVRRHNGHIAGISLLLLAGVGIAAYGIWAIVQSLFVHPDAQGALVFVTVPGVQLLACFIAIAAAMLSDRFLPRKP